MGFSVSPDGRYVLRQPVQRPYSYVVPVDSFPRRIEVIDRASGKLVHTVAVRPLVEGLPTGNDAEVTGVRDIRWRGDADATLVWAEAQDGGDPNREAKVRDAVLMQAAPFDKPPVTLAQLGSRLAGISWGRGDLALLQKLGAELGFSAGESEAADLHGERISSTRIRQLLQDGDFARAGDLLGRPYAISGRVVRGRQLGRTLGFPTANLRFPKTPALSGIYATWVHGVFDQPWPSVSSFGTRPTVDGVEPLLEAHLFDFQGDLYGRHIDVEFVAKLRDEEKFNDLAALTDQMHRDAEQARAILSEHRLRATA
ncbi:hypothetical protein G6F68_009840 [Rhizopus microsporus]|nr:hypothetical protein G6F68_009840 [Rhizopus microsporus]